jgi:hypothetical protein
MEQAAAVDWESQTQDLDTYSTVPDVLKGPKHEIFESGFLHKSEAYG